MAVLNSFHARAVIEQVVLEEYQHCGKTRLRIVCPVCGGGSNKEKCLMIKLVDTDVSAGLFWKCWRSNCCAGSGFVALRPADALYKRHLKIERDTKPVLNDKEYFPLEVKEKQWILENWGISEQQLEINGVKRLNSGRIYFPMFDYNKHVIGHIERSINGAVPKVISNWYIKSGWLHFPIFDRDMSGPVLVVEDAPSSIRASKFMRSAALMGSSITDDQAFVLSTITKDIILALDNDTWTTSRSPVYYRKKYGAYFNSFILMYLHKDIKNMTDDEIKRRLL